jgi:hypothetical protein
MTMQLPPLLSVELDTRRNALRLILSGVASQPDEMIRNEEGATLDVGSQGRLVGVELDDGYVEVMNEDADLGLTGRSARARVTVERDAATKAIRTIVLPRQGTDYEISYPSGNQ